MYSFLLSRTIWAFIFSVIAILVTIATLTENSEIVNEKTNESNSTKYILLWTRKTCAICPPLIEFYLGHTPFENCKFNNCHISVDRNKLENDYTNYDAFLFHGRMLAEKNIEMPETRYPDHKYIFFNLESPTKFPICDQKYDDFFNWTISFKLDSDIVLPYIRVKNESHHVIGPRKDMVWPAEMESIEPELKIILGTKTKMGAWFGNDCSGKNKRLRFVKKLNREITQLSLSALTVDVFGECGLPSCGNKTFNCSETLRKDYLFFFALEDYFEPDYVTEMVLIASRHNLVPVVFSRTNYSRFLPPNSYIDGRALGANRLAKKLLELYNNREEYFKYFEWKQHYHLESNRDSFACDLCELMNTGMNKTTRYIEFREWWNKDYLTLCSANEFQFEYYDDEYDL